MRCPTGFWSIHSNHKVRRGVGFERKRPHKSTSVNWVQYLVFIGKNGTRLLSARVLRDLKCCQESRSHERRVLVPALYISTFLRDNRCDSMLQSVLACICLSVFSSRMCL